SRRTSRGVGAILLAAAASALLAGAVSADSPGPAYWLYERDARATFERWQFYGSFPLNAGVQQLPRWNSTISIFNSSSPPSLFLGPPSFSPDVVGVQPGGEIGYIFRDGTLPPWIGSRVRVGLFGSATHATTTQSKGTTLTGTVGDPNVLIALGLNGALLSATGLGSPGSYVETLKVERDAYQVGLKLESDFALGPNLALTPAIAAFGGKTNDSYVMAGVIGFPIAPGSEAPTGLSERLRTREIGGYV